MLVIVILSVLLLPLISDLHIGAYLYDAFAVFGQQSMYYMYQNGMFEFPVSMDCIHICMLTLVVIGLVLFLKVGKPNKNHSADVYMAGVNIKNDSRNFAGSLGKEVKAESRNMYLENIFGEKLLSPFGSALSIVLLSVSLLASLFVVITNSGGLL